MAASLVRLGGWRSVGALVVVAAAATGMGQTSAGHSLIEKAGLIQRPTGYTALFFKDPAKPVSTDRVGKRVHYKLLFYIRNAESKPHDYSWSVLLVQRPGHAQLKKTGNVVVGPGKMAPIPQAAPITCERDRVEFIVQLAGVRPRETIHAWATCPRRGR